MKYAFSLVELSIVLVILGLLTGGILTGQSLIRAAELRSVVTQVNSIQTATMTFRDKYFSLPGDMRNATAFWEIQAGSTGNDNTCYMSESTSPTTCNGNGDGLINAGHGTGAPYERGRFWQHLANAGLIEGTYTGYQGQSGSETRIGGQNALASKLSGNHYNIAYFSNIGSGDSRSFKTGSWHTLEITKDFSITEPNRETLSAEEAWNIDTKMDDGKPSTGWVFGPKNGYTFSPDCVTTNVIETAEYALSVSGNICFIEFDSKL